MHLKIKKLRNIQFFRNFTIFKYFRLWKKSLRTNIFYSIKYKLQYSLQFCQLEDLLPILCHLREIINTSFISNISHKPRKIKSYAQYLNKISCMLAPINNQQYDHLIQIITKQIQKHKNILSNNQPLNYYLSLKLQRYQQIIFKKSMYMYCEIKIQCLEKLLHNYLDRVIEIYQLYDQQFIKSYINSQGLNQYHTNQQKLSQYKISQVIINLQIDQTYKLKHTVIQNQIIDLFINFVYKCVELISQPNKLTIKVQSFSLFIQKLENNLCNFIIKQKIKNINQQILQIKQSLINKIDQNYKALEIIMNMINKYFQSIIQPLSINISDPNSNLLLVIQNIQSALIKIKLIPKQISIGLFLINLENCEQQFIKKLNQLKIKIKQQVPLDFNIIYNKIIQSIQYYDNNIELGFPTLQKLVQLCKYKDQYDKHKDYRKFNLDKLENCLELIKCNVQYIYKTYSIKYSQCKLSIEKLQHKFIIFQNNLKSWLKELEQSIKSLKTLIINNQIELQNKMQILSNQAYDIVLNALPLIQKQIKITGKLKDNFIYLEDLQFSHFLIPIMGAEFNLYKKLENECKVLLSCIEKKKIYQDYYLNRYSKIQIKQIPLDQISKHLNNQISQLKNISKLIKGYQKYFQYYQDYFNGQKNLITTINFLKQLQFDEIIKIQKLKNYNQSQINIQIIRSTQIYKNFQQLQRIVVLKNFKSKCKQIIRKKSYFQKFGFLQTKIQILYSLQFPVFKQLSINIQNYQQLQLQINKALSQSNLQFYQTQLKNISIQIQGLIILLTQVQQLQTQFIKLIHQFKGFQQIIELNYEKVNLPQLNKIWLQLIQLFKKNSVAYVGYEIQKTAYILDEFKRNLDQQKFKVKQYIENKKKQFPQLSVFSDSKIIEICQSKLNFFINFYPFIQDIHLSSQTIIIITNYQEKIQISYNQSQNLNKSYQMLKSTLYNTFKQINMYYQLKKILENQKRNIPLALIFTADYFQLQRKYQNKLIINQRLMSQINLISSLRKTIVNQTSYRLHLFQILIMCRIQFRQKLSRESWLDNFMVYENHQQESFGIRIFNRFMPFQYNLVNCQSISFIHKDNERVVTQICSTLLKQECGIVSQTYTINNLYSRLGYYSFFLKFPKDCCKSVIKSISHSSKDLVFIFERVTNVQSIKIFTQALSMVKIQFIQKSTLNKADKLKNIKFNNPKIYLYIKNANDYCFRAQDKIILRPIQYATPSVDLLIDLYILQYRIKCPQKIVNQASKIIKKYYLVINKIYKLTVNQIILKKIIQLLFKEITSTNQRQKNIGILEYMQKIICNQNQTNLSIRKHKLKIKKLKSQQSSSNLLNFSFYLKGKKPIIICGPSQSGKTFLYQKYIHKTCQNTFNKLLVLNLNLLQNQFIINALFAEIFNNYKYFIFIGFNDSFFNMILKYQNYQKKKIFEVSNLDNVSPSAIVDSFLITLDENTFTWHNLIQKEEQQINSYFNKQNNKMKFSLLRLITKFLIDMEQNITPIKWLVNIKYKDIIRNTLILFKSFIKLKQPYISQAQSWNEDNFNTTISKLFLYTFKQVCLMNLNQEEAKKFNSIFIMNAKKVCSDLKNIQNTVIQITRKPIIYIPVKEYFSKTSFYEQFSSINYIETLNTLTIKYFFNIISQNKKEIIIYGNRCIGKTIILKSYLINKDFTFVCQIKNKNDLNNFIQSISDLNCKRMLNRQQISRKNIKNIFILIEDISYDLKHKASNTFKWLTQNKTFLKQQKINYIQDVNLFLQQPSKNQSTYLELWRNYFLFNIVQQQNYFYHIFKYLIDLSLEKSKIYSQQLSNVKQKLPKLVKFYLKLINKIGLNFPQTPINWGYTYSKSFLKQFFLNFIQVKQIKSQQQFVYKLHNSFMWNCISKLKLKQQIHKLEQIIKQEQFDQKISINFQLSNQIQQNFQKIKCKNNQNQSLSIINCQNMKSNILKLLNNLQCHNKIIVNYLQIQNESFVQMAFRFMNLQLFKLQSIKNSQQFNFQIKSKNNPFQKTQYFYVPFKQINQNHLILDFIKKINNSLKAKNYQINYKFIIQYNDINHATLQYLLESKLIQQSGIVWVQNIDIQYIIEQSKKMIEKNFLKEIANAQKIIQNIPTIFTLLKQQSQDITQIRKILFSLDYLRKFWKIFFQIYNQNYFTIINQRITLEFGIKCIKMFLQQHQKINQIQNNINLQIKNLKLRQKELQRNIKLNKIYINKLENSSDFHQKLSLNNQLFSIKNKQIQIQDKKKSLLHQYKQSHNQITRNDVAQLKCLYMNSSENYSKYFQAIALAIEGDQSLNSIKKVIFDVNLMTKIKQTKILKLSINKILQINNRINQLEKDEQKILPKNNILNWLKFGSQLGIIIYNKKKQQLQINCKKITYQITEFQSQLKNINDVKQEVKKQEIQLQLIKKKQQQLNQKKKQIQIVLPNFSNINNIITFYKYCTTKYQELQKYLDQIIPITFYYSINMRYIALFDSHSIDQVLKKIKQYFELKFQIRTSILQNQKILKNLKLDQKYTLNIKYPLLNSKIQKINIINFYITNTNQTPIIIVSKNKYLLDIIQTQNIFILNQSSITSKILSSVPDKKKIIIVIAQLQSKLQQNKINYFGKHDKYQLINKINEKVIKNFPKKTLIILTQNFRNEYCIFNKIPVINFSNDQNECVNFLKIKLIQKLYNNSCKNILSNINGDKSIYYQVINIIQSIKGQHNITFIDIRNKKNYFLQSILKWQKKLSQFNLCVNYYKSIQSQFNQKYNDIWINIEAAVRVCFRIQMKVHLTTFSYQGLIQNLNNNLNSYNKLKYFSKFLTNYLSEISKNKNQFYSYLLYFLQQGDKFKKQLINIISLDQQIINNLFKIFKEIKLKNLQFFKIFQNNKQIKQIIFTLLKQKKQQLKNKIEEKILQYNLCLFDSILLKRLFTPQQYNQQITLNINKLKQSLQLQVKIDYYKYLSSKIILCNCKVPLWLNIKSIVSYPYLKPLKDFTNIDDNQINSKIFIFFSFKQNEMVFNQLIQQVIERKSNNIIIITDKSLKNIFKKEVTQCCIEQVINIINFYWSQQNQNSSQITLMKRKYQIYYNFIATNFHEDQLLLQQSNYLMALNSFYPNQNRSNIQLFLQYMQFQWYIWTDNLFLLSKKHQKQYNQFINFVQKILLFKSNSKNTISIFKEVNLQKISYQILDILEQLQNCNIINLNKQKKIEDCNLLQIQIASNYQQLKNILNKCQEISQIKNGCLPLNSIKLKFYQMFNQNQQLNSLITIFSSFIYFINVKLKLQKFDLANINKKHFQYIIFDKKEFLQGWFQKQNSPKIILTFHNLIFYRANKDIGQPKVSYNLKINQFTQLLIGLDLKDKYIQNKSNYLNDDHLF